MKLCRQCGLDKPIDAFYLSRGKPVSPCKACAVARATARNRANPEARAAALAKWRATADRTEEMRRTVQLQQERRRAAPELVRAKERAAYAERRQEIAAKKRARRLANPEVFRSAQRRYMRSEYGRTMMLVRKHERRARQLRATPGWYDADAVRQVFEVARVLSRGGVKFSVDHIVPLKGRKVCGLHVHDNMQVIPLLQNIAKHNRFEESAHG